MTHTSSQPSLPSGPQPRAGTACAGCQVGVPSPTSGGCSLTTRNSTTDRSCFSLICAITTSSSHSNSKTLELCSHLFSTSSWDPLLLLQQLLQLQHHCYLQGTTRSPSSLQLPLQGHGKDHTGGDQRFGTGNECTRKNGERGGKCGC